MVFEHYSPLFPLNQFIESFVYYKDYNPIHSVDRFLPDANVNIVIDLTDSPKFIYDNHTLKEIQACKRVWFSGIRNKYITIPSGKDSEMFIVNFNKGSAYPFVQMPLNELTDIVVDADSIMAKDILELREMLLELDTVQQKFICAEQYFLRTYYNKLTVNPFVEFSVSTIMQNPNTISLAELYGKVGYSQKHCIKIFKEHVGVTPKSFLRIVRFQKAILEIEKGGEIDWLNIAYESGYYDQSHFINDFRDFSGFTPEVYLAMKREFVNYIPVG